jgi:DNA-binding NtrC family response regulator
MSEPSGGTLSYAGDGPGIEESFDAPYIVRLTVADQSSLPSCRMSVAEVSKVLIGRGDTTHHTRSHDQEGPALHVGVQDSWMSSRHAELIKEEDGRWRLKDSGSKNGTFLNDARCEESVLADGDLFHTGNTTFLFRSEVKRSHLEPPDVDASDLLRHPQATRTLSLPLARTMKDMARVATSSVSIILGGETGTGKEVCAHYLHETSRRAGAFVAVNCGALPANLVESELFGHRKGAFSGALRDRVGLVQASDGGTLFLDEVAELPLDAQVKLLRVLQEREVVPLGATRPIPVDLRIIAASHADLEERASAGHFRADLLARLSGVSFRLPALRERREDIGILVQELLQRTAPERNLSFEREALWAIALYSWPRNIRELEQALAGASARAEGGIICLRNLPENVAKALHAEPPSDDEALRDELIKALRAHKGNVSATAREMGKARVQIRRWCKRFGLDAASFR